MASPALIEEEILKINASTYSILSCPDKDEFRTITFMESKFVNGEIETWTYPYGLGEIIWGIVLVLSIFSVNIFVFWIIVQSKELWKPRHVWMACLCITDFLVGIHKMFELLLLIIPSSYLCIINKATFGIPYILNIMLLTFLSLDRFLAVSYPLIYSSFASNKHVMTGFAFVILTGFVLCWTSINISLKDEVCRVHWIQLKYLIVSLTICSILTLFFNISVLRVARRQLTLICATDQTMSNHRPISVICTNCGHKTKTLFPATCIPSLSFKDSMPDPTQIKISTDSPLFSGSEDSHANIIHDNGSSEAYPLNFDLHREDSRKDAPQNISYSQPLLKDPMFRAVSVPVLPGTISSSTQSISENKTGGTMVEGNRNFVDQGGNSGKLSRSNTESILQRHFGNVENVGSPRKKPYTFQSRGTLSFQFFRNLHFSGAHHFQIGRLFPSIRFAKTVLLIMIPMWIFILPVITIIPLHEACGDGKTVFGCPIVEELWTYLLVHIRSVLLLQAILDTIIYALRSKEFKHSLRKIKNKRYKRNNFIVKKRKYTTNKNKHKLIIPSSL